MNWTAQQVADTLDAELSGLPGSAHITGFSIDSRTLRPGQCFVAIEGPRFNGHDFVQQALDRGASACIVSDERCPGFPEAVRAKLVAVPQPLEALHRLALEARRRWGKTVIGVTGSVGKTTTKEMLAAMLAARCRVLKSEGNLNNEYGLPLSLLRLEDSHDIAVLEMAMAHPGEIARLCRVAEPDAGVVIGVAPVHLEFFASVGEIAAAKRELIEGLKPNGIAVLNADDERVAGFAENFSGEVVWFGFGADAGCRGESIADRGLAGCEFDLVTTEGRERVALRLPGRQHIQNALAACAAAGCFEVSVAQMREALESCRPAAMRGEVIRFEQGFTVVNDAYNSNPAALGAMTEALSRTPDAVRRLLVAGEMKELGPGSPRLHEEAGAFAASRGNIDFLAGVSGDARNLVDGARQGGMNETQARFFAEKPAAAEWLCDTVRAGDWVLLKASRGVELETLLDALRQRFHAGIPAGQGAE